MAIVDIHASLAFNFSANSPMQQMLMSVTPITTRALKPLTAATLMAVMSVSAGQDIVRYKMRMGLVAQVSGFCVHAAMCT